MLKKSISKLLVLGFCLMLTGCGKSDDSGRGNASVQNTGTQTEVGESSASDAEKNKEENNTEGKNNRDGKVLSVYFSRVGNTDFPENVDAVASASLLSKDGETKGNAQMLAEWVANEAGGDVFEIVTENSYPADYSETTDVAKQEQNEDARPKLKAGTLDFSQYDTFYLVFPNWWGDLPQALYSFFDEYDFSGKRLNVFVTHGGSSFSSTIQTIQDLESDAEVVEGLSVRDSGVPDAESEVREWVKSVN